MTSCNKKLKILALHGYHQSDIIFRTKIGSIRKIFKKEIDFIFIKAPHKISEIEESACKQEASLINNIDKCCWWFSSENDIFDPKESNLCIGFDESIELIKTTFKEQGPIDGLLGFSQGGSFTSILCAMQQKKSKLYSGNIKKFINECELSINFLVLSINFCFAIIISGFKSMYAMHKIFYDEKLLLPTLHVYGKNDQIIPIKMSEELSNVFINKLVVTHEGGHYVPSIKNVYNDFIQTIIKKKIN